MGDMVFSILETPEITVDADTTEKFRAAFAYDEKEILLGCTSVLLSPACFSEPFFQIFQDTFLDFFQCMAGSTSPPIIFASNPVVL